jgi:diadenosine tetraphosphate (Ap4A) HIT family hydrolase
MVSIKKSSCYFNHLFLILLKKLGRNMKISNNCIFCKNNSPTLLENHLAFAILDKFPVSTGHTLIIPKRHFPEYFDITWEELKAVHELILKRKDQLMQQDASITGFNLGINNGRSAGQTVMHLHVHLIPRRENDTKDPTGGVRGVISGKQKY